MASRCARSAAIVVGGSFTQRSSPSLHGSIRPPPSDQVRATCTRELVFEPLEFLERLAAMTPRAETNLLICHGVLAPRARWRARVVVYGRRVAEPTASTAPLATGPDGTGVKTSSPRAWSWAALMHRAFGIDVLACAHCGGRLRLIATLHDPAVNRKILAHLALAHSGQSPGPAPPASGAAAS